MVLAADLSASLGLVPAELAQRVTRLIERAGLPVRAPAFPMPQWFELMAVDKKASDGDIRYVLLDGPGRAGLQTAPRALVEAVIRRHSGPGPTPV
jgi:3-dehydroquinate synthase